MNRIPLAVFFAALSVCTARADGLEAGQWRLTTLATVNGRDMPAQQSLRCLRPEDVADLERTFSPVFMTVNSDCERVEHESTPQRLKWRLICRGQMNMDVAGEFVFETRERYVAIMNTKGQLSAGGPLQSQRSVIEATRVGECK